MSALNGQAQRCHVHAESPTKRFLTHIQACLTALSETRVLSVRCVIVLDDGEEIIIRRSLDAGADEAPSAPEAAHTSASSTQRRKILDVLGTCGQSLKASAIARRLNMAYSGSFRRAIKTLREAGDIVKDDDWKYRLAEATPERGTP